MISLLKRFIKEEDGLGTVEIVIIIAVLVGIALIFKDVIIKIVTNILDSLFKSSKNAGAVDSKGEAGEIID